MSYLEQYDNAPIEQKVQLATRWIRTDWQPFFKELRENRPIFETPKFTFVTLFKDVQEVLSREEVFSVRLYAPKMDRLCMTACLMQYRAEAHRSLLPWGKEKKQGRSCAAASN